MSPFAPRSSFAATSLHLIMPITSTRVVWREGGRGRGGGRRGEGTSCPFSFGHTQFHSPCVHYGERFDLNNITTLSCQEMAKTLRFISARLYLGLVTSHSPPPLLLFQETKNVGCISCQYWATHPELQLGFHSSLSLFPSKPCRVNYLQSLCQQTTLK